VYPFTQSDFDSVYAKFKGKLHKGDASIGVTVASWGQSRSMIIDRLTKIRRIFKSAATKRILRRSKKPTSLTLANDFLEGEFGWVPLLADIHALTSSVCNDAIPRTWTSASSKFPYSKFEVISGSPKITQSFSGWGRCTYAAGVDISNPNLWLANRLGLINPLVVAWDLVPWSFVVNMFVNVNQVLSSLTDTVGLTLTNESRTTSSSVFLEQSAYTYVSPNEAYYNFCNMNCKARNRVAGVLPRPSLRLKLPGVNFELLAIASALTRQQVAGMR
jgi:hypothetical protein